MRLDVVLEEGFSIMSSRWTPLGRTRGPWSRYPSVIEVRGVGMMWGMKCGVPNGELVAKAFDHGLLTVPAGDNVNVPAALDRRRDAYQRSRRIMIPVRKSLGHEKCGILELKEVASGELRRIVDMGASFKRGEKLNGASRPLTGGHWR